MDALHQARVHGLDRRRPRRGRCSATLMDFLEGAWDEPDEGIWEVRGPRRHFTHSKVMAWVAFDRAVEAVERFGLPTARSTAGARLRDEIHDEVCREGFDAELELVHAVLRLDRARRVDAADPARRLPAARRPARRRHGRRDRARADARRLRRALRDATSTTTSTACPAARACSCRARSGSSTRCCCSGATTRRARSSSGCSASATTSACSPRSTTRAAKRLLGNFPQAFTHVGLVNSAYNLSDEHDRHRSSSVSLRT